MTVYNAMAKCYETHAIISGAISRVMLSELNDESKYVVMFNLRIGRHVLDAIQFDLITELEEKGRDTEISASIINAIDNICNEGKYFST